MTPEALVEKQKDNIIKHLDKDEQEIIVAFINKEVSRLNARNTYFVNFGKNLTYIFFIGIIITFIISFGVFIAKSDSEFVLINKGRELAQQEYREELESIKSDLEYVISKRNEYCNQQLTRH